MRLRSCATWLPLLANQQFMSYVTTFLLLSYPTHFSYSTCLKTYCKETTENCRLVLYEQYHPTNTPPFTHFPVFPVDMNSINMYTHPGQGRRRPTAARRPSAVSFAQAGPAGQNQSSYFPQEKRDKPRCCSHWLRRRASEVGPKSALLTSPPSRPSDSLISQTQHRD